MWDYLEKFKKFVRFGHPYRKAIYVIAFLSIVFFVFGLGFLLPRADSISLRSGLTIIAEILGVLLGAVLVVVGLLIEQGHRAEELLRAAFQKYYHIIDSHFEEVDGGRQQLIKLVKNGQVQLYEPAAVDPSGNPLPTNGNQYPTKFRDVIGSLSALTVAMDASLMDQVEHDLDTLGYSEEDKDYIIYGKGILADHRPEDFLQLVYDSLNLSCIVPWCSNNVSDFACEVFEGYSREKVRETLSRLKRSRNVLKSKTLAAGIAVITLTIVGAILSLFGITDKTVVAPIYTSSVLTLVIIILIIMGFILSVLLALFLIEKMFT